MTTLAAVAAAVRMGRGGLLCGTEQNALRGQRSRGCSMGGVHVVHVDMTSSTGFPSALARLSGCSSR